MKGKSMIFLILSMLTSCFTFNPVNKLSLESEFESENELPRYWKTAQANPRGVVMVVHGLNVRPSKMGTPCAEGTLVKLLFDNGYHVYRVTLKGHSGALENMQTVTQSDWLHDAYAQYGEAKTIAEKERLPLYLLGFSLGALVYEVLMSETTEMSAHFKKIALFSPAVAIKPAAKMILWMRPFTNDSSIIRSASPKEYRAQPGASMAAYKAVFNMEEVLRAASFRNCNVSTIVFIDKNDEMISASLLRKRISKYNLTNWRIYELSNAGAVIKPRYHHLLIDNKCMSEAAWQSVSKTILNFLID
jgi:esterase/lipase